MGGNSKAKNLEQNGAAGLNEFNSGLSEHSNRKRMVDDGGLLLTDEGAGVIDGGANRSVYSRSEECDGRLVYAELNQSMVSVNKTRVIIDLLILHAVGQ